MHPPKKLKKGDYVAITAPAGPVNPEKIRKGAEILKNMGLNVIIMPSCAYKQPTSDYLSAPDDIRADDLHTAFADPKIKAVFAARGGYGAARLLPLLNFNLIRQNPKIFAGYSDITALHIAINQICKLITYHAPMPAADLPAAANCQKTMQSLKSALFTPHAAPTAPPITGGNLSVIAASLGTPFEIDTKGKTLFMEETNEPPYKIDRLLTQLKQAGKFKDAAGFLLGDFSCAGTTIKPAISELIIKDNEQKPIQTGFPCGHTLPNVTIPLGYGIITSTSNT